MNERQVHALDLLLDDHFALWDFADCLPEFRPASRHDSIDDLIDLVRQGLIAVEFGAWFDNQTRPVRLVRPRMRSAIRQTGTRLAVRRATWSH
ncbi:MAG TPA: hypothetical protein VH331_02300 [Allosphingosinicella sp.]|jgi:hypothetical protein|nr:hypothetical protein [Allosphingosinicella sp.]